MDPGTLVRKARTGAFGVVPRTLVTLALVAAFAAWGAADATAQQTGNVTGSVTKASTGEPIVGAQVSIEGTGLGALTNNSGRFVILNVPAGQQTVHVQFVGWGSQNQTVNVEAGGSVTTDFELRESAIEMEGLVVTGTPGQARRREVGNSIAQLTSESIETQPVQNVHQVLQGRTSGVQITSNNGMVGAGSSIRIRGQATVSGGEDSMSPLIYVDGVRMSRAAPPTDAEVNAGINVLDDINPQDIARIEVVRGPAATTLYGTEAAAGVIQIFTKAGVEGDARWSYTTTHGFNQLPWTGPDDRDINPSGLGLHKCDDSLQGTPGEIFIDPSCQSDGDHIRNGYQQQHNLSVRGGTENVSYFISGNWRSADGVIEPQNAKNWGLRGNFGFEPANDLTVDFNSSYSHRDITWIPDGNNAEGFLLNVFRGPRGYTPNNDNRLALEMDLFQRVEHVTTGINAVWTPVSGVSQRFKAGLDYFLTEFTEENPFGYFYDPLGERENDTWQSRTLTLDYAGSWSTDFTSTLSSNFSWGGQLFQEEELSVNGFGERFAGPGRKVLDNGSLTSASENRITEIEGGAFVQEQIGFNDRFFITAGLRVDGNSNFGEDFGAQAYPKLSGSYLISDHDFTPDWINTLKLRAAWGQSGKAPGPFDALRTFQSVAGDGGQPGVSPDNVGAPDLGPERSTELEGGFEASLIDNRVTVDFTLWDQKTEDALVDVQPIPSAGFVNAQLSNVGQIDASGGEVAVDVNLVRSRTLDWSVNSQFSWNDSEAVDLGGQELAFGWGNFAFEGYQVPVAWGPKVQNPNEVGAEPVRAQRCGDPGVAAGVCDGLENGNPAPGVFGSTLPTHTFSFGTDLTLWNNLTLSALAEGQGGHVIEAGAAYQGVRREAWPTCLAAQEQMDMGDLSGLTALEVARCTANGVNYEDWFDEADFLRIRNVSLTYRVPGDILPSQLSSARVTLGGNNLWIFTDYGGVDPEAMEDGGRSFANFRTSYYNLPITRTYTLELSVTH